MERTVAIGIQRFDELIEKNLFYVDKTMFIKEWWESGFGRYDVMLEPKDVKKHDAIILEFKVQNRRRENSLEETLDSALKQIEEKQYAVQLMARGIPKERIRSYGIVFRGKEVLIG